MHFSSAPLSAIAPRPLSEQKKERECMQLRIGVLRSELERQRKALGRETDLRQKERAQLHKKGNDDDA